VAPPFKQIEFDIMYGEGVSKTGELIDLGVKAGIVEKSGSWFSFDSERIGQGRENAKQYLKEHPQVAEKIERAIRQNAGLIAGQILEGASEASSEGAEGDESATGFAEDGTVAPIAGGAARRGRR
jgi:recombination protein RecA